jgi:hypothetical protein
VISRTESKSTSLKGMVLDLRTIASVGARDIKNELEQTVDVMQAIDTYDTYLHPFPTLCTFSSPYFSNALQTFSNSSITT